MLLRGQQNITDEEKRSLLEHLEDNRVYRETLSETLNDMSTGRNLEN